MQRAGTAYCKLTIRLPDCRSDNRSQHNEPMETGDVSRRERILPELPRAARRALCSAAACGLILFAGTANSAQPDSGSFRLLVSLVHDLSHVKHGNLTHSAGGAFGTSSVIESSGGPFAEGMNFTTVCVLYSQSSGSGFDLEAPCLLTDGEGNDANFFAFREAGDLKAGGGRLEIRGGAGAFTGTEGECAYTTEYLSGGKFSVTDAMCRWQQSAV